MTNIERAKAIYTEVFDKERRDLVPDLFHPDFVQYEGLGGGAEAIGLWTTPMRDSFPDLAFHVIAANEAENGDVWVHATFTGSHLGTFQGLSPTGRQVVVNMLDRIRFRDGLVIEHWGATDLISLLHQIGDQSKL